MGVGSNDSVELGGASVRSSTERSSTAEPRRAAEDSRAAIARVEGWIASRRPSSTTGARSSTGQKPHTSDLLTGVRGDADGFAFTRRLLEAIVDVRDPFASALGLRALSQDLPPSLPARDRLAVQAGGLVSLGMPWAVLPAARRHLRDRVSSLVLSTRLPRTGDRKGRNSAFVAALSAYTDRTYTDRSYTDRSGTNRSDKNRARGASGTTSSIASSAGSTTELLIAHQGEPVLGPAAAAREVKRLIALASLPEVTHLAIDPARVAPRSTAANGDWALDADAELGASVLRPLFEAARDSGTTLIFEPSDYRGALLAPELLARTLTGSVVGVRAGLRLPAELPESREAAEAVIRLSRERMKIGAEPLELTIHIAGLAASEQIASVLSGHPVPTLPIEDSQAQLLRLTKLTLEAGDAIRTVVATEDPLLLSLATLLAERSGSSPRASTGPSTLTLQLRAGIAPALAEALAKHGFSVRVRLPLAAPGEFTGAVAPLIHLAAEATRPDSALSRAAAFASSSSAGSASVRADDLYAGDRNTDEQSTGEQRTGEPNTWLTEAAASLEQLLIAADEPFPPSHRIRVRSREWDAREQQPTQFYVPPTETERFDTGGLTAAVLGLSLDATGQIVIEQRGDARRIPVISESGFANEPDSDASLLENRKWSRGLLARASVLRESLEQQVAGLAHTTDDREALVEAVDSAAEVWGGQRATDRAARVARLALGTASARDRLITVLAAESGAPIGLLDADASGAIDAARYLGQIAPGLASVRGAEFQADRVALVAAGAGIPLAERAEAVLAALTAGSAVLLVAHPSVAHSSVALIEEWQAAGLPENAVTLAIAEAPRGAHVEPPGDSLAQTAADPHTALVAALVEDPRVRRAIVLGRRPTARAVVRHRPGLKVEGRFRALGASIVTPSAETGAAVRGIVASAFGGGAEDARGAHALILVGSASRSKKLRKQLTDAVRGLRVGDSGAAHVSAGTSTGTSSGDGAGSADPLSFDLGPLPQEPTAAGLRALTELQSGETWLVEPEQVDADGLLWRPGVRIGVKRDAQFWADAAGMPVIGVISANSLNEAISLQNKLGGGGVGALFAGDATEALPWLDNAHAASLTIGHATTSSRVERQPGGGWGSAGMGAASLTGGPNRLVTMGSWRLREGTPSATLHLRGLGFEVQTFIETTQSSLDYASFDRLRRAALADALTWRTSLGRMRDGIGLGVERNLLRRWPVSTHIRLAEGGSLLELARAIAAGMLVDAPMTVSVGGVLPAEVSQFLAYQGITVALERDDAWLERMAVAGADAERVRLIGGDPVRTAEWFGGQGHIPLWAEPVTMAGPVELLAFLREQSVSITAHRHGLVALPTGIEEWIAEHDDRVK